MKVIRSYFLEVLLEIESASSRSVSPKNLSVLFEPLDEMFFMLVDFAREIDDLRSIVEAFDGS
jgi:hypothetical protein